MAHCTVDFSIYFLGVMMQTRRSVVSIRPILFIRSIYSVCKIHAMLSGRAALCLAYMEKRYSPELCRPKTRTNYQSEVMCCRILARSWHTLFTG